MSPDTISRMTESSVPDMVLCSPAKGCGELKPRSSMAQAGPRVALCWACYQRARRQRQGPEVARRANLWSKYRIRLEQYDAMREQQGFRCGICGIHESDIDLSGVGGRPRKDGQLLVKNPLAVDHDHKSGAVRGLLCPPCNTGLGGFGDDPSRLLAAIAYLESHTPRPVAALSAADPHSDQRT